MQLTACARQPTAVGSASAGQAMCHTGARGIRRKVEEFPTLRSRERQITTIAVSPSSNR
jgi:hypothetical protein